MKPGTPGFVGQRLREVREARNITGIALAEQLGVTRQAVSQYETGRQSPAPEVMRRICTVLRQPMHRFLRPVTSQGDPGVIFYRSMATATKAARVRAERRYGWLREIVDYLRRFIRFPAVKYPDFSPPEDPRWLSAEQIEEFALNARRFWGLGDGPISNVLWLVENNGAVVARHELFANGLDAFSPQWAKSDEAPFVVLGSDKGSAARSRFDVAHELAHLVLHRRVRRSFANQQAGHKLLEEQAHRFAGAFLLPERSFAAEFSSTRLDELVSLKAKWKVSVSAMTLRARHLGLISKKREQRLLMNLSQRGWRRKEPLDDVLEPEEPRLLKRSFDLLMDSKLVARHQIPFELALAAKDIEELAGLPPGYLEEAPPPAELLSLPVPHNEGDTKNSSLDSGILPFPGNRVGQ